MSLALRLVRIAWLAEGVAAFELRDPAGGALPPFTAGAHIGLRLTERLTRSYSLLNPQHERHRYVIGVKHEPAGRGGSRHLHETVRIGALLAVAPPVNDFPLDEAAPHSVLIAGGIGITPIWCMVQRLAELGRSWRLHYAVRNREAAPLLAGLATFGDRVDVHVDAERGALFDMAAAVDAAPEGTHFYGCGPAPMLAAYAEATASLPPGRVHAEYFSAAAVPALDGGFTVELARAGLSVRVAPGETILDALRAAGFDPPHACEQGVCGTCETRVLSGMPDHRDSVLSAAERAAGRTMMICCSGSRDAALVLDL